MTQFLYVSKKYPVHIYSRNTNKYIFILNLEGEKTMNKTQPKELSVIHKLKFSNPYISET